MWAISFYKKGDNAVSRTYSFMHEDDAHACMDWDDYKYMGYAHGQYKYEKGNEIALVYEKGDNYGA